MSASIASLSQSRARLRVTGAAALVLLVLVCLWVRRIEVPLLRAGDGTHVLSDTDSFMRWRLVERALQGEGVRIRWVDDDNAPYGRMNEWTAPMTIVGVAAVRAEQIVGRKSRFAADDWARLWIGPLIGSACLVALGWLGWLAGGWAVALCWMLPWVVMGDAVRSTRAGNVDHHGLHQFLFIIIMGGCLTWRRQGAAKGGIIVGLACAAGLWSAGSEILVALALVAALAVYEVWHKPTALCMRFWHGWWLSGFVGTLAAWLYEFWPAVFHRQLEVVSIWHVGLWMIGGLLLECMARQTAGQAGKWVLLGIAMAAVFVGALALRGFDWTRLHVTQDQLLERQIVVTTEFRSMLSGGLEKAIGTVWWKLGLLPFLGGWLVYERILGDTRFRWLGWVAGAYLMLTLYEARWDDFFTVALTMVVGIGIAERCAGKHWYAIALVAVATLPPWWLVLGTHREIQKMRAAPVWSPEADTFALAAVSKCLGAEGKRPIVLAWWGASAKLAGMGRVRVVGTGYWSNLEGLRASHELFATTQESRFWQIVRERQIEYVVVPEPQRLARLVAESWYVWNGKEPRGLEWQQAELWKLFTTDALHSVPCEELTQRKPHWQVFQLDRDAGNDQRPK